MAGDRAGPNATNRLRSINSPTHPNLAYLLFASLLLALHFWLGFAQMTATSPTFDEAFHLGRGWAWWRTGRLFTLGHPALGSQLAGFGLLLEPNLPEAESLTGWQAGDAEAFSEDLLWKRGLDATRMLLLARIPFLLLSVGLGALTALWAAQLYGPTAGLIALALHTLSPNLLANAPLAATDLLVAAFYVTAWYAFLRALDNPTKVRVLTAGIMLGLLQASKFSAVLIAIPIGLWIVHRIWTERTTRPLRTAANIGGIGLLALWAVYGFSFRPFPLASYFDDVRHILDLAGTGHWAYMLGRLSPTGWWYYHPFVLLVKTPLPLFILFAVSTVAALRLRRSGLRKAVSTDLALLIPALLFLLGTMVQQLSVGYRYLLPMLPFMHIYAAGAFRATTGSSRLQRVAITVLGAWLVWGLTRVHPNYLAYFNELGGGPENGWRLLTDSNLDWGQSLPALAEAVHEREAEQLFLSYFGQADPGYYGLLYSSLPGWPPPSPEPDFNPLTPEPGLYAISTSNLVGVQLYEPNVLAWFRTREPDEVIDHTLFLYEVPERARGRWFYQCEAPGGLLDAAAVEDLVGNIELAQTAFDCESAMLIGEEAGWVLVPGNVEPILEPGEVDYQWRRADGTNFYTVYQVPKNWTPTAISEKPVIFGEALTFLGIKLNDSEIRSGEELQVTAGWHVNATLPPPLSIYAHLIAPNGSRAAAGDALAVQPDQWHIGDRLWQQHILPLPADIPPGEYELKLGLYRLDNSQRYLTPSGEDGIFAATISISD